MGVNMNFLMNLIQLGLDVGILALCCEAVFRQKSEIKAKDFFIFPILLVLCVVPRVDFSVGANMTASFRSEGFEILPADNIVGLLFLIFAVLLLSSIFFGSKSSGTVFCGTMAAFSIFLFVKCLCAVLFAVCGATDILLLLGSRIAALCLIVVLEFTPLFGLIHQLVQRSDFTVLIVSANIAVLLMAVLSILSFDVDRILSHLWVIIILILAVLLLDSILLFLHQRRTQEQKRIHMIEQYVPKNGCDFPESLGVFINSPGFIGIYNGFQNLKFLADIQGKIGEKEIRQAMSKVGLDPDNKTKVDNYSLGMKQKLGLAQAIMEGQDILILDEPFNALDYKTYEDVKAIIRMLKAEGKTIFLTSHHYKDIEQLCDQVYSLEDCQLLPITEEIAARYREMD